MMFNDAKVGFLIAYNTLKRGNKKTTFLTIFILSLIFVNLIFLPSMINGMMNIFVGTVIDYSYSNIIIEPAKENLYIENSNLLLKKINSINGVECATRRLASAGTLKYNQKFVGANILGINPETEMAVSKYDDIIKQGEFLTSMSRDEIVLGALLAGKENGPELYDDLGGVNVGTRINVTFSNGVTRSYKIKGIHEAGPEISDLIALVHYKELEDVLGIKGQERASTVIIKIENLGDEASIKEELVNLGIKEEIYTWQEKIQDIIRDLVKSFGLLTILSEIVSLIIAIFVIFIILYINTLHRKKQIGILKAIGITPLSIIFSYIMMSLFYIISGLIFGTILLGLILLYLQYNPIIFYETISLTPKLDIAVAIRSIISLLLTSIIAGFIPAWMVVRQDILNSIWDRE
ncbi:MAG: ABC transporter permease [Nanoarchaeota archaeon]